MPISGAVRERKEKQKQVPPAAAAWPGPPWPPCHLQGGHSLEWGERGQMASDTVGVLAPEENRAGTNPDCPGPGSVALGSLLLFSLGLSLLASKMGSLKNPPHGRSKCRRGRRGMLCGGLQYGKGLNGC